MLGLVLAVTATRAIHVEVDAVQLGVTVHTDDPPLHRINPLYVGCHSDSGFTHQVTGFSSQMIEGESFEAPPANCSKGKAVDAWSTTLCKSCDATIGAVSSTVSPAMYSASSYNPQAELGRRADVRGAAQPRAGERGALL